MALAKRCCSCSIAAFMCSNVSVLTASPGISEFKHSQESNSTVNTYVSVRNVRYRRTTDHRHYYRDDDADVSSNVSRYCGRDNPVQPLSPLTAQLTIDLRMISTIFLEPIELP